MATPDPPADAAPAYRQPHGRVRDLLRFLRNGFGLLPGDRLGVPVAREEAAAGARREGFGPPSSERTTVPQHRSGRIAGRRFLLFILEGDGFFLQCMDHVCLGRYRRKEAL